MSHIDQDELLKRAGDLKDVVSDQAGKAFDVATELTKTGVKAATPKVMKALNVTVKTATPIVDAATESAANLTKKTGVVLDKVHQDMVKDYLPRLNHAVEEAALHAGAHIPGVEVVPVVVAPVEVATPKLRKRKCRKGLKWGLVAASAAGVAYLMWRRSQPIEDPWAEEYWTDLETDVNQPPIVVEEADTKAEETTEEDSK